MSSVIPNRAPPRRRAWSWRSQAFRGLVYQIVAIALIALGIWFLAHNTLENMRVRGIQSGFSFLTQPAGFDIGESIIAVELAPGLTVKVQKHAVAAVLPKGTLKSA